PRNHFTAGAVGGKIYAIGGRIGDAKITRSSNTDVVEEYDPATDEWNLRARMPTARSGTAGAVYEGRIFVLGGEYQTDQVMMAFRACEAYRPTTDRWEELPHMQAPRHGLAAALLGTRLHALGGDSMKLSKYPSNRRPIPQESRHSGASGRSCTPASRRPEGRA
ncbi:MAG: hypothetical protein E6H55_16125, partial [Betaproteobacteria bacterium]